VRAAGETSYRADIAFCVMTLLAALVIACDTDLGGSSTASATSSSLSERGAQPTAQVDHQATADARKSPAQTGAITRR